MPTFAMKFGDSLAPEADHRGSENPTGPNSVYYSKSVPYDPARLTREGEALVKWQRGRDIFPVRNQNRVADHPDERVRRAYAGLDDEWNFVPQPHASTADELLDCTDWINAQAERSGYFK